MAGEPPADGRETTCEFHRDRQTLTLRRIILKAPWACNSNTLGEMRECYVMTLVLMILVAVERLVFQAVVAVEFGAFYHF